jgi:SUN family beta-glucosidase
MTIPLTVKPGQTAELAVPDLSKYFWWSGQPTSVQYYVNSQGIPESDSCTWSNGKHPKGNWAPMVFGAAWDDINMNMGFVSITSNYLTQDNLNYDVNFVGEGENVINACKYKASNREVCTANGVCSNSNDAGCTVSLTEFPSSPVSAYD